jgi:hypothetical protein
MQFGTAGTNNEGTNDTDGDKLPTCDATDEHQDVVLQAQQSSCPGSITSGCFAAQTPGWMLHLLLLINLPASPDVTDALHGFCRAGLHWRRICRMVLPRSRQASSSRVLPVAVLLMNRQAEACRSTRDCSARCLMRFHGVQGGALARQACETNVLDLRHPVEQSQCTDRVVSGQ